MKEKEEDLDRRKGERKKSKKGSWEKGTRESDKKCGKRKI